MTRKFNSKVYQGKARVYSAVPKAPRISRLWIWDEAAGEYKVPDQGNVYYAARYETDAEGTKKRKYESFASLEEGRRWQSGQPEMPSGPSPAKVKSGPLFREMMEEWKRRRFPLIAYAKRHAGALTKVVHGFWEKKSALLANACEERIENGK